MRNLRLKLLLCIAVCFGMNAGAVDYIVKGTAEGHDGTTVYLRDYNDRCMIDSAIIVNGHFEIKGKYGRDAYVRVEFEREYANIVLSDGITEIDFASHGPKNGSTANQALNDYTEYETSFFKAYSDSVEAMKLRYPDKNDFLREVKLCGDRNRSLYRAKIDSIFNNNLDNGVCEVLLMEYNHLLTPDEWEKLYATFPDRIRNLKSTEEYNRKFMSMKRTAVGQPFIDIKGKDMQGNPASLSDYIGHGKYVLVDFWASWCGPCIQEATETIMPLYEEYKNDDRLIILSVATWDKFENSTKAIAKHGYQWSQLLDTGMKPMEEYGFDGIPQIMLFGPDGTILQRDLRGPSVTNSVEEALKPENR